MSLLNDMLRDLVKQQKVVAAPIACSHDIMQDTSLFKSKVSHWVSSAIIFAVVFLSVLGFKYLSTSAQLSRHLPSPVANQHIAANDVLPSPQKKSLTESDSTSTAITSAGNIAEVADPVSVDANNSRTKQAATAADEQLQRDIAELLLQANRALTQDKLTAPLEDNAYSYFQTIATLSPNHPQAKVGLELIAARYLEKAREQLSLGNAQQAEVSRQRAKFVAPDYFIAHDFSESEKYLLQNAGANRAADTQTVSANVAATTPQAETIKPFVVAEAEVASLNVVPNAAWKDEQLAGHADGLVRSGKIAEALNQLKNFVIGEEKPIRSTALLGDIYFQQGNAQALEVLVKTATYLPEIDRARLHAQMLAAQGNEAGAIAELEKKLAAAENNEQYRAFLASLYHKTGQYQQSVVSYQRLLNSYGEKPAYWLGLALAFDGLLQNKNALQAYQHLLGFPQLQEQVRDYINQRISALREE